MGVNLLGALLFIVGGVCTIVGGMSLFQYDQGDERFRKPAWLLLLGVLMLAVLFLGIPLGFTVN